MEKIEIINYEEDSDEEEEEDSEDEEIDEEYEDESEEEKLEVEKFEEHKNLIKQKTDRELLESISSRLFSLETDMKNLRDDLVDVYNLILENAEMN